MSESVGSQVSSDGFWTFFLGVEHHSSVIFLNVPDPSLS